MDLLTIIGVGVFAILVFMVWRSNRISETSNLEEVPDQEIETKSPWEGFIRLYLYLYGPGMIVNGIIQMIGIRNGNLAFLSIADVIYSFSLGIVYVICAVLYHLKNQWVIWVYGASVIASLIFAFAMGRGFNIYIAIFGGFVTYQLFKLQDFDYYA